jgi:hypothetical protein
MENSSFFAISCLMFLGAAVLFVIIIIYFIRRRSKQSNQVITEGKVIAIQNQELGGVNEDVDCPVVEFSSTKGETIQFASRFGSSSGRKEIGQVVKVAYDPHNPEEAEISSTLTRYLVPGIIIFLMTIALCMGVCFVAFGFLESGAL